MESTVTISLSEYKNLDETRKAFIEKLNEAKPVMVRYYYYGPEYSQYLINGNEIMNGLQHDLERAMKRIDELLVEVENLKKENITQSIKKKFLWR
jgi:DNA-binding Lrp family transcriptional regulator